MIRPYRRLAARFVVLDVALCAAVIAIRFAYENPDEIRIVAAGTAVCAFCAAFSLLLSAALGYGWESARLRAQTRYEARLGQTRPLGPIRRGGYRVAELDQDPNGIYEALEDAGFVYDSQLAAWAASDEADRRVAA
jgi:hypothetical protein